MIRGGQRPVRAIRPGEARQRTGHVGLRRAPHARAGVSTASRRLDATLEQVESNTGVALSDVYVDKGYRGHDYRGEAQVHLAGSGGKRLTRAQRKRRNAIFSVDDAGRCRDTNAAAEAICSYAIGDLRQRPKPAKPQHHISHPRQRAPVPPLMLVGS